MSLRSTLRAACGSLSPSGRLFRWVKCLMGCGHWLVESPRGVTNQLYLALIGALLLQFDLGRRPSKRIWELYQWHQVGMLEEQIGQLLAKADAADSTPLEDGLTIAGEVARRRDRIEELQKAVGVIKARAKERHSEQLAEFEAKQKEREEKQARTGKKPGGRAPKAPSEEPQSGDQYNFTDEESRIMSRA